MQNWQITTGLATLAVLAAAVVPSLPGLLGGAQPPTVEAPLQPPVQQVVPAGDLALSARLDQGALLQNGGEDRFLVIEVSAEDLPGDVRRKVDLAVVMDVSGSMAGSGKITHARTAAAELAAQLQPEDRFSLVTFSDRAAVPIPAGRIFDMGDVQRRIARIHPAGGTNLYAGLSEGLAQLGALSDDHVRRVVVLSDGKANIGRTNRWDLTQLAGSMVASGVTVSALGLGLDYNEDLLAAMSDTGGGSYHFIDQPTALAQVLSEELTQMTAVAGRSATVSVDLADGVQLMEVYGYEATLGPDGYSVFLGDVHGGEDRKIVARVRVPDQVPGTRPVAQAALRYADPDSQRLYSSRGDVQVTVTPNARKVLASVDKAATRRAGRARAASLVALGAVDFADGDVGGGGAKLEESAGILSSLGQILGDATLMAEAEEISRQRADLSAAPPASEPAQRQLKATKEYARDASR